MGSTSSDTIPGSQIRQKLAQKFYLAGWIGFWIELVLAVISASILAIALSNPGFNINLKSGMGLLSVMGGLFILALMATQIIVGALLLKVLTIPGGLTIYQTRQLIEPLDIFVAQASTLMIAAGCIGLLITFWLLKQVQARSN